MPIAQTTPRPIATPGIASSAVAKSVSPRDLPLTARVRRPKITAPLTAPMKAPTIPCQKWSGRKTVKCQRAMPIVNQTSRAITQPPPAARLAIGASPLCSAPSPAPPVFAALLAPCPPALVALALRRRGGIGCGGRLAVARRAGAVAVARWLGGRHGPRLGLRLSLRGDLLLDLGVALVAVAEARQLDLVG